MTRTTTIIAAILLCSVSFRAQASMETSLDEFLQLSNFYIMACGQDAVLRGRADYQVCRKETEERIGKGYKAHLANLRTPKAKEALKEFYIGALSALDGVPPVPGETKYQYDARMTALSQKLKDLAARVRVENMP